MSHEKDEDDSKLSDGDSSAEPPSGSSISEDASDSDHLPTLNAADAPEQQVGYRKPPKHGQFKKGTSGNLDGRPKGSRNFRSIANEVFNSKVIVHENGKKTKLSKKHAFLLAKFNDSLKNDRNVDLFFKMIERYELSDLANKVSELTVEEKEVLDAHDARVIAEYLAKKKAE